MKQFDPNIPNPDPALPGLIGGDVTTVVVIDPAGTFPPFEVGNHVVNRDEAFAVDVNWEVTGLLAPLWLDALKENSAGNRNDWDLSVYAESVGGGSEIRLGTKRVRVDSATVSGLTFSYSARVDVPPSILDEHTPGSDVSGVYKLVVAVFLNSDLGRPGYDMTGFNEGPIIQVENPV